ncbi:MAG: glycosyltransferase family 2 protein [Planctomycetota bacterium]|jgi:glycosyltransferase involved in cell wall biosynthesis
MNDENAEIRSCMAKSETSRAPLISVIIPTYNHKRHVVEAIGSVLSQTRSDFELLLIDDGSTDGTDEAVKAIDDRRILYFYQENEGLASARNTGLDKARGKYIAFLDSDDLYTPEYLETMVSALENNADYGVSFTAATNHYSDGCTEDYRAESCCSGWITEALFDRFFLLSQTCVIRAELLEDMFFDKQAGLSEDLDFFLRLSCRSQFLYVPKAQIIRRLQFHSLSRENGTPINHDTKIRVLERFYCELGGDQSISKRVAHKRFSRQYRKMGLSYHKCNARKAALSMFEKAILLNPLQFKIYHDFLCAYLTFSKDLMPDWELLPPLKTPARSD